MIRSTLLLLGGLLLILQSAHGDIIIQQIDTVNNRNWTVEGLASYDYGGCCPIVYEFHCSSTINNGQGLFWSRKTGGSLEKSLQATSTGIKLLFTNPTESDAGVYGCRDDNSDDPEVLLNITTASPVVQAINKNITVVKGSSVTIGFYAAALPNPHPDNITWSLNSAPLNTGNFDSSKKRLTISSVSQSDAGTYRLVVNGVLNSIAADTSVLTVLNTPTFISSPQSNTDVTEWASFTLTCNVTAGADFIITWHKINGTLPVNAGIVNTTHSTNTISSRLSVSNARVSDSGQYRCHTSFLDGSNASFSNVATIVVKAALRFEHNASGDVPAVAQQPILYTPTSQFYVECQGSGVLTWADEGGAPVSTDTAGIPYQETMGSFKRLVFTDFGSQYRSVYSCSSTLGVANNLFITNDNPAIYSTNSTLQVGNTTNTSLLIYVGGDPVPSPENITWFFNGSPLQSDSTHYQLREGNTVLVINAPSDAATGTYQSTVATSQGTRSILFNVTYFDPPVVTLDPPLLEKVLELGESFTLRCNATSVLDSTVSWSYQNSSAPLPEGVTVTDRGSTLVISSAESAHTGIYYCTATDGLSIVVSQNVSIKVQYAPLVGVGHLPTETSSSLNEVITEGTLGVPTFYCTGQGYPSPSLSWSFNGNSNLPSGVVSTALNSDTLGLRLLWTRPVTYTDEGTYRCIASNSLNTSIALLNIKVNATPTIYSIYSTLPIPVNITTPLTTPTFGCPMQSTQQPCNFVCVARGWPAPTLYWIHSATGRIINTMFMIRNSGVVTASLEWNGNQSSSVQQQYRCEARNEFGNASQPVTLVTVTTTPNTTTPPPTLPNNGQLVKLRLRLLTSDCHAHPAADQAARRDQLRVSLVQVVLSQCQTCSNSTDTITVTNSACDNTSVVGSTVFVLTLSGPATGEISRALADWWASAPTLLLQSTLYNLDTGCDFVVRDSSQELACSPTVVPVTTSSVPSATPTVPVTGSMQDPFQIIWVVVVSVIVALCVVVSLILLIVVTLCIRTVKKQGDVASAFDASTSTLRTYRSSNQTSILELNPLSSRQHLSSSSDSMLVDNPEYTEKALIDAVRKRTSVMETDTPLGGSLRVLQTTPTNDFDFPYSQEEMQVSYPPGTARKISYRGYPSEVSVRNTPIQEILYQESATPTSSTPPVFSPPVSTPPSRIATPLDENMYDMIRVTATRKSPSRQETTASPRQHATLPRSPTSPKYSEPTPPLRPRQIGRSTPALGQPLPYTTPVSSQRELNRLSPTTSSPVVGGDNQLLPRATSVPTNHHHHHQQQQQPRGQLPSVNEGPSSPVPWWGHDTDIVTPTPSNNHYNVYSTHGSAHTSQSSISHYKPISRHGSGSIVSPTGSVMRFTEV